MIALNKKALVNLQTQIQNLKSCLKNDIQAIFHLIFKVAGEYDTNHNIKTNIFIQKLKAVIFQSNCKYLTANFYKNSLS